MLPKGYVTHDEIMASLPAERRVKILEKTKEMLLKLDSLAVSENGLKTQKQTAEKRGAKK